MTEKGMSLKELRDQMLDTLVAARKNQCAITRTKVRDWINALDQIMRMPEYDPNQISFLEPVPRARTTDRQTSHDAAQEVAKHDLNEMRGNILYLIGAMGPLSDPELKDAYAENFDKEYAESTIRTRRNECVMMGWLKELETRTKKRHTVWQITGIGWDALTHWRCNDGDAK